MEIISFELDEEQYDLLRRLYPKNDIMERLKDGKKGSKYSLEIDNYCDFVLFVDDAIVEKGMINQDYLTKTGVKIQEIYDSLIHQSCERNKTRSTS